MNQILVRSLPTFVRIKIEGRPNLQKIIGNTGWLFADKILRMGVGLFVGVWVARYLGPEQLGLLSYAAAFVALFSGFATFGLSDIVIRDIVHEPSLNNEILGTTFILKLVGGISTFFLTGGILFLWRPHDNLMQWLVIIIAFGMVAQTFDTIDFWFQSQIQSKPIVYARNIAFILVSLAKVALILNHASLVAFAGIGLAELVLSAIGFVVAYRLNGYSFKTWRWSTIKAKSLLHDSWPFMLAGMVGMVYRRIDQFMLGGMVGNTELGLYAVAVLLSEIWYFIPMAVYSSVLPSIVESKGINEELFYARVQKLYNFMALFAYAIAIPTTFLAAPIINTLYGEAYSRSAPMLVLLIWSGLFVNLGIARSTFITTMNWTKIHLIGVALASLINIILNYFLIPKYGGTGAACASLIAYWFATHGICFFYPPLFKTGRMLTKAMIYPKVW